MMKSTVRYIIMVLLVASTLGLSGCGKKQEKKERPPKLDIVSVDKFTGSLLGDCTVTLTLANNTAMKITINSGEVSVKHNGKKIGQVVTREGFTLPPRKHTQVIEYIPIHNPDAADADTGQLVDQMTTKASTTNHKDTLMAQQIALVMGKRRNIS